MICVIGELALHVFVPAEQAAAGAVPEPAQLGGGAGMIVRHLALGRTRPRLVGMTGADPAGTMLRAAAEEVADCEHAIDDGAGTSVAYLLHDQRRTTELRIVPGGLDPGVASSAVRGLDPSWVAYCPAFPGHDGLVATAVASGARTVLDFGFAGWAGDEDRIRQALRAHPPAWLAQISGGELERSQRRRLLDDARAHGYEAAVVTGGAEEIVGFDGEAEFEVASADAEAVCTVGCGDVFVAEILRGTEEGRELRDSCEAAAAAASAKAARWGVRS